MHELFVTDRPRATMKRRVKFIRFADSDMWPLPTRGSARAAGLDLAACVPDQLTIGPGEIASIQTGWGLEIPVGFEGQIRPRSGLALKHGLTVVNVPGTIDNDYRGEMIVGLINLGKNPFTVRRGDRIAQLVISPYLIATPTVAKRVTGTGRGTGGFGSTGT